MTAPAWRPMTAADLPEVSRIAAVVHPDYPESDAVFAERLALFPPGCRILAGEGACLGYAVLHPARLRQPPVLDTLLGALPADADCLYLHDVALLPEARGSGAGARIAEVADRIAADEGLRTLALTATPPARAYWLARGFTPVEDDAALAAKLTAYGPGMTYMTRTVA